MTGLLRSTLRDQADRLDPIAVDLDAVVAAGTRIMRRRAVAAVTVAVAVVLAVVLPFALNGQPSAAPRPPVANHASPSTPSSAAPSTEAPKPAHPWLRPIAMVGSKVYDGRDVVDTGVSDLATFVNTRGSLVLADTHGNVYAWRRGGHAHRIGRYGLATGAFTVDASSRYVAWFSGPSRAAASIDVYDTVGDRLVLHRRMLPPPGRLSLDSRAAYFQDHSFRVHRVDLRSGQVSVLPLAHPSDYQGVVAEHVFVFHPGGGYLRPLDRLDTGGIPVPLEAESIAPSLRYGAAPEGFGPTGPAVFDLRTGHRVQLRLNVAAKLKVGFYGWLGPQSAAFSTVDGRGLDLYACDLPTATCTRTAAHIPEPVVEPGFATSGPAG